MLRSLIWRTLVTNSGITVLGLANSILLSRWLGPTGRGEVAAAMLWPTLLIYLSSMGLISSVLYFAALPDAKTELIFGNSMSLAAIQSVAAVIIGYLTMPYLLHSQTLSVVNAGRLYLLVIPLSLVAHYCSSLMQGGMHISAFNWLRTIIPFGYLAGTLTLMVFGRLTLFNIVTLHLILNVLVLIGAACFILRARIRLTFTTDADLAKQMLRYGAKIQVGNISGMANQSLDQVLMAALLPPTYLGLYVVAVSAAGVSQVFSQAVQMISTPSITQRESLSEKATVLKSVFRKYWVISLLITLAVAAILPLAIPIVFGSNFRPAVWPAEILLLGAFLIGAKEVLAGGAQALGNPWLGSKAHLYALIVTVGLLSLLLPRLGIVGAAIATSAAYGTQLLIVVSGLRRSHSILPKDLFRITLSDLSSAFYMFRQTKVART